MRYKFIRYKINVMQQFACLIITQLRLIALLLSLIVRRLVVHQT